MDNISVYDLSRLYWTDHIVYTRAFAISAILAAADKDATLSRLLANQDDIASLFRDYGEEVTIAVAKLLREHIEIAGKIVVAAKSQQNVDLLVEQWKKNADDIAHALAGLKGKCDCCDKCNDKLCSECECCDQCTNGLEYKLREMLYSHLDILFNEVTSYLQGDYDKSIEHFDMALIQALEMSNDLYYAFLDQD